MSWPVGSFSKPLTELNRLYYNVTLDDGTTTIEIFYDEQLENWRATEGTYDRIYPTGDGGITIDSMMTTVKTLTAEEVEALKASAPTRKDRFCFSDSVFSYDKLGTGTALDPYLYERRMQSMVFQPGDLEIGNKGEEVLLIFTLPEPITSTSTSTSTFTIGGDYTHVLINYKAGRNTLKLSEFFIIEAENRLTKQGCTDYISAEGNGSSGIWGNNNSYWNSVNLAIESIDAYARTHTFEETWYTLEEYNTKHSTNYTYE